MALTKVILTNLALSKIGSDRLQITDFDNDTTIAGSQARLHYDVALDELVRMHPWACCKKRAKLVKATTTDPKFPLFQYQHAHTLPTDYIRATYVSNTDSQYTSIQPRVEWVIEDGFLLTDFEEIWMCYDKRPDPTDMDSLFARAFYTYLAMKLAVPITGDRDLEVSILKEFDSIIMPEARRVNGFEKQTMPVVDSEWLESTIISPSTQSQSWPPFSQTNYGSF